jgi:hypothetical protein
MGSTKERWHLLPDLYLPTKQPRFFSIQVQKYRFWASKTLGNHRNFNQTIKPWDIGDSWTKTWILMELDNQETPLCEFAQVLWWPKKKLWGLVGYTVSWLVLKLEISTIITQIRRKGLINHRTTVFGKKTHGLPANVAYSWKETLAFTSIYNDFQTGSCVYIYICVCGMTLVKIKYPTRLNAFANGQS